MRDSAISRFRGPRVNARASRMKRQQLGEVTAVEHKMTAAGASQWRRAGPEATLSALNRGFNPASAALR
jgi:hypothetical protein